MTEDSIRNTVIARAIWAAATEAIRDNIHLFGIYIDGVEVTQAIQYRRAADHLSDPADRGPDNSIRLVADKAAYVRVYVRGTMEDVPNVSATVTMQRQRYGVWVDSGTLTGEIPGSITAETNPTYATERGSLWNSLNFMIPASLMRGQMRHVVADAAGAARFAEVPGDYTRTIVGGMLPGWTDYALADAASAEFVPDGPTPAGDPLLLYFTSGTTAQPKMVLHTQQSYPVGHLTTMYWLGLRPGDVHLNISSPGWGKHAWSSFYAPWNAGATIFVLNQARFDARFTLDTLVRCGVTSLCAPPTVWRVLILEDLAQWPVKLNEVIGAGEPLNPEVIERVRAGWGLTLRDGYGQTESTCMVGNPPGLPVRAGSMGQPMPGYRMVLLDTEDREADEGELAVTLNPAPTGLMAGYAGDADRTQAALGGSHYRTSDVARRDADGYYWYVGRADDVFKASDYRISPFELESALLEHPLVAEAAVVPSPDAIKLAVPKAFVVLKPAHAPTRDAALDILRFLRGRLSAYKRVRRIEFAELPKTISGKIRRVQLRQAEDERRARGERGAMEFWEEDFNELK